MRLAEIPGFALTQQIAEIVKKKIFCNINDIINVINIKEIDIEYIKQHISVKKIEEFYKNVKINILTLLHNNKDEIIKQN